MKKRFLILILCLSMLILPACDVSTPSEGKDSDSGSDAQTQSAELIDLLKGSDDDYVLVYPENASDKLREMVISLRNNIKDRTGIKPSLVSDKNAPVAKEIVIGPTNREESATVSTSIGTRGYRLEWIGEKLVINGSSDFLIEKAIEDFLGAATSMENRLALEGNKVISNDASSLATVFANAEKQIQYTIVITNDISDTLRMDVTDFRDKLWSLSSAKPNIGYASSMPKEYEILIGDTGRDESDAVMNELGYFNRKTAVVGNKIVIAAKSDALLADALNDLYNEIVMQFACAYNGEVLMNKEYVCTDSTLDFAADLPTISAGEFEGIYDSGQNSVVISHKDVEKAEFNEYVTLLHTKGFETKQTSTLGNNAENEYVRLESNKANVYLSYLSMTKQMRVFIEALGASAYPEQTAPTQGGSETPTFWMLKSDYIGSGHNGGSSFVYRLSDGTYIVEDGGYNTDAEADQLYEILCKYTPKGEKPVISLWIITHLHTDHFGCFQNFAPRYRDKVDVKAFAYNFPTSGVAAGSSSMISSLEKLMKDAWPSATLYNKLHSGMKIGLADALITVICTHEDVYPYPHYDMNDTCTVVRIDIGGQRFMLLADACRYQSEVMSESIPVSELKSDFVQVAHHGYEGCLKALYEKVNARIALWTMSIYGYRMDTTDKVFETWMKKGTSAAYPYANQYICNESSIEQILIDGAGTVELALPYTDLSLNNKDGYAVNGNYKFPDYKGIYEETKKNYPR